MAALGQKKESVKFCEKWLQKEPENIVAASTLYQVTGKKKEKKVIDKAIKEYEKYLKDYFESFEFEDEDEELFDDELPF